jgi:predicted negative regulator of RcsB-dependent stress response
MAWFWKGKTLLAKGNNKEAMEAWETGSSSFRGSEMQNSYIKLCAELQK